MNPHVNLLVGQSVIISFNVNQCRHSKKGCSTAEGFRLHLFCIWETIVTVIIKKNTHFKTRNIFQGEQIDPIANREAESD